MKTIDNPKKLPVYSYSKVRNFYSCPYSFYLNYFEKSDDFIPENHGSSEFGIYVHKILELYEKGELGEYELLDYYKEHYCENVDSSFVTKISDNFSKDLYDIYYESGERYFEDFNGYPDLKILESEYEFFEEINESFIFTGKIDLIALDSNDNLIVIDHKSKGKFKNKAERDEYSKQLYLYAFAVFKKYNKFPNKLAFNMIRTNKWIEFKFDEDRYSECLNWLKNCVNDIETCLEFPATPNTFFCNNFCIFRNVCEYTNNSF